MDRGEDPFGIWLLLNRAFYFGLVVGSVVTGIVTTVVQLLVVT
jgi:hypothetical protein